MAGWIRRHPVRVFVLLTFGISYGLGIPALMIAQSVLPPAPTLSRIYLSRILIVAGPAIAALAITGAADGWPGIRRLILPIRPAGRDLAWMLATIGLGWTLAFGMMPQAGVAPARTLAQLVSVWPLVLAHFLLQCLVIGLGEELGWRAWLLPRLLDRLTPGGATILLGLIWGAWHGPLLLSGLATSLAFIAGLGGISIIFTWIWQRSASRLAVMAVAHASVNTPLFVLEQIASPSADQLRRLWIGIELGYASAGIILLAATWPWWRRPIAADPAPARENTAAGLDSRTS